jgi:endonuclease YncB( thermonuclease family)
MVEPCYRYAAICSRVIDGDTFIADVNLGFYVRAQIRVRVHGINAAEMNTAEGKRAKAWALETLLGEPLMIESFKDEQSFNRWVCDVWVDDKLYADAIVAAGYAEVMRRG